MGGIKKGLYIALLFSIPLFSESGYSLNDDCQIQDKVKKYLADLRAEPLTRIDIFEYVVVSCPEDEELKKLGLSHKKIRDFITSRLRTNNIKVATEEEFESGKYSDRPNVSFVLSVVGYAFHVSLEVEDDVIIERLFVSKNVTPFHPSKISAPIWDYSTTGTHGNDGDFIMSTISTCVDKLTIDYLKVNK